MTMSNTGSDSVGIVNLGGGIDLATVERFLASYGLPMPQVSGVIEVTGDSVAGISPTSLRWTADMWRTPGDIDAMWAALRNPDVVDVRRVGHDDPPDKSIVDLRHITLGGPVAGDDVVIIHLGQLDGADIQRHVERYRLGLPTVQIVVVDGASASAEDGDGIAS